MTDSRSFDPKPLSLREAFDQSFAQMVAGERPEELDFLEILVAGDPYALRVSEVQSLHASRRIVAAPSELPELLGLAGFRGIVTPVYDLSRLLGYGTEPVAKWLVVARNASPIAFAFGGFESHLRVVQDRVSAAALDSNGAVRGAVQRGGVLLPLLHLPSLVAGIAKRVEAFGSTQQQ